MLLQNHKDLTPPQRSVMNHNFLGKKKHQQNKTLCLREIFSSRTHSSPNTVCITLLLSFTIPEPMPALKVLLVTMFHTQTRGREAAGQLQAPKTTNSA